MIRGTKNDTCKRAAKGGSSMDPRQMLMTEIRFHFHEIKKFTSAYREKPRDIHQQIFYLKLKEIERLERDKSYQEGISRLNIEGLTEYCEMLRGLRSQIDGKRLTVESSSNRTIQNYNAREDAQKGQDSDNYTSPDERKDRSARETRFVKEVLGALGECA